MIHQLKTFQVEGAEWLASKKYALLADEMRVGKTPQAVAACDLVGAQNVLVICPAIARHNWARDFKEWSFINDRKIEVVTSRRSIPQQRRQGKPRVVITSYDLAFSSRYKGGWDVVILDEVHYLGYCSASRTQQILGNRARHQGLVHRGDRVWMLSGTPATSNASQLWPMLYVFGVYKKSYEEFVRAFCVGRHTPYGFKITGSKNIDELRSLLAPFMFRRKLADVAPQIGAVHIETLPLQPAKLSAVEAEFLFQKPTHLWDWKSEAEQQHERFLRAFNRAPDDEKLPLLESMFEHTATVRRYLGMCKVPPVVEYLETQLRDTTEKFIVFAEHVAVCKMLAEKLSASTKVCSITGRTKNKDKQVETFKNSVQHRVMVANVRAASTNIDLSVANRVLFVEADWLPGTNQQAIMRTQHLLKTTPVDVQFVSAVGSMDEAVQAVLARRSKDLALLFD